MPRQFVVVTSDGAGLGWAKRLNDEGEAVALALEPDTKEEAKDEFSQLGEGFLDVVRLSDALKRYGTDAYWIFDTNCNSDTAMLLRKRGAAVFGAHEHAEQLEHDRAYAMDMAKEHGLSCPEMYECSTVEEGLVYLEQNDDKAYVFKPNDADASHLTFVPFRSAPELANQELQAFLLNITDPLTNGYVLQERKTGVEVTFCLWLDKGTPILGECTLENKRQLNADVGENGPCSQDVIFTLPLDAVGLTETVKKLVPLMSGWTGFLDVNCIVADNQAWFLETGCRYGYNAHPNLFTTLAIDPVGDIMADWMDGQTADFSKRFRSGFGASVSLRLDHPRPMLPIHIDDDAHDHFYPYDLAKTGEQWVLTGYSPDIGVYARHGYTIKDAADLALADVIEREYISFPDMGFRTDLARCDYPQAPQRRYDALKAMGWI